MPRITVLYAPGLSYPLISDLPPIPEPGDPDYHDFEIDPQQALEQCLGYFAYQHLEMGVPLDRIADVMNEGEAEVRRREQSRMLDATPRPTLHLPLGLGVRDERYAVTSGATNGTDTDVDVDDDDAAASDDSERTAMAEALPACTIPPGVLYPINSVKSAIRTQLLSQLARQLAPGSRPLRLVGVLASSDEGSAIYARMTRTTCISLGVEFDLISLPSPSPADVKARLRALGADRAVDGVILYTPIFSPEVDDEVRRSIPARVDVEGLSEGLWDEAMRREVGACGEVSREVFPPTPLAVVRALQMGGVFDMRQARGRRLLGKTVAVINRSRTVGQPLAQMLANDGALVYSLDIDSVQICSKAQYPAPAHPFSPLLPPDAEPHSWTPSRLTAPEVYAQADVIVSAVPGDAFVVPPEQIKVGAVTVNVASGSDNFAGNLERVRWHLPRMGALTILSLVGNVAVLRERERLRERRERRHARW